MRKRMAAVAAAIAMAACVWGPVSAAKKMALLRKTDAKFYTTAEARRVGDQVLAFQRVTGGWPKNVDMESPMSAEELAKVAADSVRTDDSTTDNMATTTQLTFLARLYKGTGDARYRDAFRRGMEYLLSGQYANGGWPQFWPGPKRYQIHITYNDGAMANTMELIRDVAAGAEPYDAEGLIDTTLRERLRDSFNRGIDCVLATQIVVNGEPTVWCQQHDRETLAPTKARAFELPSFCSQESAQLVAMLMRLPDPDERVKRAVHGAMRWFDANKIAGHRIERTGEYKTPTANTLLVADPDGGALWGRFYDLDSCKVFVCDRDGVPRRSLEEIGLERRNGYSWYNEFPAYLYEEYDRWADRYDPAGKVAIDMTVAAKLKEEIAAKKAAKKAARQAAKKAAAEKTGR
ncbi:MAG: pectate lyase [[Clostridium] fimetarium]|nr:pectate lyase [Alistipes timonensis]MCM1405492.1 pectate lyase [[Clostridium] fimetarium]